jgi:hypothetical protein
VNGTPFRDDTPFRDCWHCYIALIFLVLLFFWLVHMSFVCREFIEVNIIIIIIITGKQMVPPTAMNNSNMNTDHLNNHSNMNTFNAPTKSMSMTYHSTSQSLENEGGGGGCIRSADKTSPRVQSQHHIQQQPSMTSSLFGIGISKAIAFVMNSPSKAPIKPPTPHSYNTPPAMRLPPNRTQSAFNPASTMVHNAYGPSHGTSPSLDEKRTRAYSLTEAESGKARLSTNQHPYGHNTSSKSAKNVSNVSQSQISPRRIAEPIDGYYNSDPHGRDRDRDQGGGRLAVVTEEKRNLKGTITYRYDAHL